MIFEDKALCGLFYFWGWGGDGSWPWVCCIPGRGRTGSPLMSHGRETSNVCKHLQAKPLLSCTPPIPHLCRMDPPEMIRMLNLEANVEGLGLRWEAAERRGGCCLVPLNSGMRDIGQELTKGGSVSQ